VSSPGDAPGPPGDALPGDLRLSGDLRLEVDGTPVRVRAEGAEVRVVADDVRTFVARAREAAAGRSGALPGRRDLGRLAAQLADRGVTARLDSPSGRVLTVGAGVDSAAGGVLLGTRLARPESAAVLTATDQGRLLLAGAAAGLAVAVALLVGRRR
jgi:hypothetical protein